MDECDITDSTIEMFTRAAIGKAAYAPPELDPNGTCYNCEASVPPGAKFCDADCSEDWHYRKNTEARRSLR